nr:hypothetical protein Iba_chr05aCG11210 [Ipomoea batatas]GMD84012.1 hypothetical protein Iba_chr14aCG10590 [Ipomoea batatas]GMD87371.1 hypothetical protein Iba_chr14bCG15070 [Ipomoea batatas]
MSFKFQIAHITLWKIYIDFLKLVMFRRRMISYMPVFEQLALLKSSSAQLGRIKRVVKYIVFLMLEVREMKEESGSIYLRVSQL